MLTEVEVNSIKELLRVRNNEIEFCNRLSFNLTLSARGVYSLNEFVSPKLFKGFNELQHIVSGQALSAYRNVGRYTSDALLKIMMNCARTHSIESSLNDALDAVLKHF